MSALDLTAEQHLRMLVAVQPFIDSSISKTVNVPADYPFEAFKELYLEAWKAGLKGLATYRPNAGHGCGAVGRASPADGPAPCPMTIRCAGSSPAVRRANSKA